MLQVESLGYRVAVLNILLCTKRLEYAKRHEWPFLLLIQLIGCPLAQGCRYSTINSPANGDQQALRACLLDVALQEINPLAYLCLLINGRLNAQLCNDLFL
ncbi:hypothetical protein D1872_316050 [compost metagenome]